ncbi:MAG TPA: TIGR01777 family oxidoreductase [Kineosporiaceae bacterium]|nr:TIGR01777 family oxidoreductase [Kineosporiaceae bacterium]
MTGASGLIGTALVPRLRAAGHDVVRLVRRRARADDEVSWDPAAGEVDLAGLGTVDATVHLAGAGVGDHRWTAGYKRTIRDSRIEGTRTLVGALCRLAPLPRVLVSGSAVGFYGSRGEEELTEDSPGGEGFLAEVVRDWEAETGPAAEAGIRVVQARTGLVLAAGGGALGRMLPLLRLGLAGPLGNGRQWWPWITLDDEVAALIFLLDGGLAGPVNLCAPEPARNREVTAALGQALHRPTLLPAPAPALRLALGEFAGDVLASQRALPRRLLGAGYRFAQPTLADAARWAAAAV